MLAVSSLDDFKFTPAISHAGFHGFSSGGYPAIHQLKIDEFHVSEGGAPMITLQPSDRTVQRGSSTTLECEAIGGVGTIQYQWEFSPTGIAGTYLPLEDGDLIFNSATSALEVIADAATDGRYRCVVTDEDSPPSQTISYAADLTVANPTTGCVAAEPPLYEQPDACDWVGEGDGFIWICGIGRFYTPLAQIPPYYDRGRITRTDVPIPVGYDTVTLEFTSLYNFYNNPTFGMEFRWGSEAGDSVPFEVDINNHSPTSYTIDLKDFPSWHEGEAVNGFFIRDLTLHLHTRGSGYVTKIDIFPGARHEFTSSPMLVIRGDDDDWYEPQTFGANKELKIQQTWRNTGCDMDVSWEYPEEREIEYTLCTTSGGNCRNDLIQCGNDPDANNYWRLPGIPEGGDWRTLRICDVTLPEGPWDTQWELRGTFLNDPTKSPVVKRFILVEHGTPNLVVTDYPPWEAHAASDPGNRRPWLDLGEPFDFTFWFRSYEYVPPPEIPIEFDLWARVRSPGDWSPFSTPSTEWVWLGSKGGIVLQPGFGTAEVTIEDVTFGPVLEQLQGRTWALLDVKVIVDPDNLIPELNDLDNDNEVPAWLPVSDGDLGAAVGDLRFEEDFAGVDPSLPQVHEMQAALSSGGESSLVAWADHGVDNPFMWWSTQPYEETVGGILVRYRKHNYANPNYLTAGARENGYSPGQAEPDLMDSRIDLIADAQWRTVLWRVEGSPPFGDLPGSQNIPLMVVDSASGPISDSDAAFIGVDLTEFWVFIDYIGVWSDGPAAPVSDAFVNKLMYLDDASGQWYEMFGQVEPNTGWTLGVSVGWFGAEPQLQTSNLTVTRDPGDGTGTIDLNVVDMHDVGNTVVFELEDPGYIPAGPWIAMPVGVTTFNAVLVIEGDNPNNNTRTSRCRLAMAARSRLWIFREGAEDETNEDTCRFAGSYFLSFPEQVNTTRNL